MKPVQFTPDEAEIVADALRDVRARQFCEMIRSDLPEIEKSIAYRKFACAERAIAKVREA